MSIRTRLDFLNHRTHRLTEEERQQHKECPICRNDYNIHETLETTPEIGVRIEPCNHVVGLDCLRQHITTNGVYHDKCPCCRAKLFAPSDPDAISGREMPAVDGELGPDPSRSPIQVTRFITDVEALLEQHVQSRSPIQVTRFITDVEALLEQHVPSNLMSPSERAAAATNANVNRGLPEIPSQTTQQRRGAFDLGDSRLQPPPRFGTGPATATFVSPMEAGTIYPSPHDSERHPYALYASDNGDGDNVSSSRAEANHDGVACKAQAVDDETLPEIRVEDFDGLRLEQIPGQIQDSTT